MKLIPAVCPVCLVTEVVCPVCSGLAGELGDLKVRVEALALDKLKLRNQLESMIPTGHERCDPAECNVRRALLLLTSD